MNAIFTSDASQKSHIRTFVNIGANDLTFTKLPDGRHKTSVDVLAVTLSDKGDILDERPQNLTLTLDDVEYKKLMTRGLVASFSLPIKNPGGYQVRLAVRDVATARVGSANQYVEVPNVKKDRLFLSGMALESVPSETWQSARLARVDQMLVLGDPLYHTAVRQFQAGSVLRFAYHVYNAKLDGSRQANLAYRLRLFAGQRLVFETPIRPIPTVAAESQRTVGATGALKLGEGLAAGDYVLQVDISDPQSKDSRRTATQFIQFEIVP